MCDFIICSPICDSSRANTFLKKLTKQLDLCQVPSEVIQNGCTVYHTHYGQKQCSVQFLIVSVHKNLMLHKFFSCDKSIRAPSVYANVLEIVSRQSWHSLSLTANKTVLTCFSIQSMVDK